jgi:hypothetical protein
MSDHAPLRCQSHEWGRPRVRRDVYSSPCQWRSPAFAAVTWDAHRVSRDRPRMCVSPRQVSVLHSYFLDIILLEPFKLDRMLLNRYDKSHTGKLNRDELGALLTVLPPPVPSLSLLQHLPLPLRLLSSSCSPSSRSLSASLPMSPVLI